MNFLLAAAISIIFILLKFMEMRFIEKDYPLKYLLRDSILVYFSFILGSFVFDQVYPIMNKPEENMVFTGNPEF